MSRLGSRLLPVDVIHRLHDSEEETPAEGQALRHGVVSRAGSRSDNVHNSGRLSPMTSSISARGIARRRSASRVPYFVPRSQSTLSSTSSTRPVHASSSEQVSDPTRSSWRRSTRLRRVRNSISTPISHMLGHHRQSALETGSLPHISTRSASSGESENLPPLPVSLNRSMDLAEPLHDMDPAESGARSDDHTSSPMQASQSGQGSGGVRRLPSLLRARSARVLRREEQTPLSRVLQLAAAAIAAQLSGSAGPMMPSNQAVGNNGGLDGSLENFIQTLQNATSMQANPTEGSNAPENGPPQPVNFLRVFRFSNPESPRDSEIGGDAEGSRGNNATERMDVDDDNGNEGRTVTLVVVGVRSVPADGPRGNEPQGDVGPGLDALLGLPFLSSRNQDRGGQPSSRTDTRSRIAPRPFPFMRNPSGLFPSNESLRQRAVGSGRRPSDTAAQNGASRPQSMLSESPPGPFPPPSTPAESNISGSSTPNRRLSAASALPNLHEGQPMQPTVEPAADENIPLHTARQRRRSDSEYARHRDLGSGSMRRNGMVEPDNAGPVTGRSWLIYVVGTNLSENHPAFATPSLFTDVRSPIPIHTKN